MPNTHNSYNDSSPDSQGESIPLTTFDNLTVSGHGKFSFLTPLNSEMCERMHAALETKPFQWLDGSLIVETRYLPEILEFLGCYVKSVGGSSVGFLSEGKRGK